MKFLTWLLLIAAHWAIAVNGRWFGDGSAASRPPPLNLTDYIVVYKPGASVAGVIETRRWSIGNLNARYRRLNMAAGLNMRVDVVDLNGCRLGAERGAMMLSKHPNVEFVERDQQAIVQVQTQPNPPSWGLDRIDQRTGPLDRQFRYDDQAGGDVTVFVVDTGVRVENPEFEGRARWGIDFTGQGYMDGHGHGTHCAGTIASRTYGVAKKAKIVAVKVLDSAGSGTWSNVIAGINWVATNCVAGMRCVMSMSLGGGYSSAVNLAVQNVYNKGVVPVVAAGNENGNACWYSPASATVAITVGATDINDNMAGFSNWGPCVDIEAPGVSITSTLACGGGLTDCFGTWSGTSMAAPHVSGIVALIWTKEKATLTAASRVVSRVKALGTVGVVRSLKLWTSNLLAYDGL